MAEMRPLQSAFLTSAVPMALVDDEGRYVDVNPAACLHLQASADDLRGRHLDDVLHDELREQVPNVAAGRHLCAWLPSAAARDGGDAPISQREREVLLMVAHGATVDDIASRLVISPNTVRTHIRNARLKLGAGSRAHAIALALSSGLLPPPF